MVEVAASHGTAEQELEVVLQIEGHTVHQKRGCLGDYFLYFRPLGTGGRGRGGDVGRRRRGKTGGKMKDEKVGVGGGGGGGGGGRQRKTEGRGGGRRGARVIRRGEGGGEKSKG